MKKWYATILLIGIAGLNILAISLLQGCTSRHQLKSYVSVEKAPIKFTYIDYSQDIKPTDVDRYIKAVSSVPYRNTKLNESSIVDVRYNVSASSDHSASSIIDIAK